MDGSVGSGMGDARQALERAEIARTAGRRMIARGERPLYRIEVVQATPGVRFRVVELPWEAEESTIEALYRDGMLEIRLRVPRPRGSQRIDVRERAR